MYGVISFVNRLITSFYGISKEVLEKQDLINCPGQLYNVDKTGMPFDHYDSNVVPNKRKYNTGHPVIRGR